MIMQNIAKQDSSGKIKDIKDKIEGKVRRFIKATLLSAL